MAARLIAFLALTSALCQSIEAKQKVLLYSRTAGFRHASIPNAVNALEKLGKKHDFDTVSSENQNHFETPNWLYQFDALVFVSVSGEALSKKGEVNMMKYIEDGGGYFGIHEACDALYHSPWYGRLVGGYFNYHPYLQEFTLDVQSHNNPSTSFLNKTWTVKDEVYNFNSDPRKLGKTVVLTADSSSFKDPGGESLKQLASVEGAEHPIAWYQEGGLLDQPRSKVGGGVDDNKHTPKNQRGRGGDGRSYYTALGHTKACWEDDTFLQHIQGAMQWVLNSPSIRSNNASLPSSAPGSDPDPSKTYTSDGTSTPTATGSGASTVDTGSLLHAANAASAAHQVGPLALIGLLATAAILL